MVGDIEVASLPNLVFHVTRNLENTRKKHVSVFFVFFIFRIPKPSMRIQPMLSSRSAYKFPSHIKASNAKKRDCNTGCRGQIIHL